jgi:hypothetical protein
MGLTCLSTDLKGPSRQVTTSNSSSMTDRCTPSAFVITSMSTRKCTTPTELYVFTAEALNNTPPTTSVISTKEKPLSEDKYALTCTQWVTDDSTISLKTEGNTLSTTSSNWSTNQTRGPTIKLSNRLTTRQITLLWRAQRLPTKERSPYHRFYLSNNTSLLPPPLDNKLSIKSLMKTKTNIYPSALFSEENPTLQLKEKLYVVFKAIERARNATTKLSIQNQCCTLLFSFPSLYILFCYVLFASLLFL